MAIMFLVGAFNHTLRYETERNDRIVLLGEDIGKIGGVFRVTQGLQDSFGENRVIDTPLSELGIIGASIGMAMYGLLPVPEIQFADFIWPAYDQIVNELAKFRYRSGSDYSAPMVIRTPVGGGIRGGHYHSQHPEALFAHVPGLRVVCPSNPADAKGLLLSALRGKDPVIFLEPKRVYRAAKGEVPEGEHLVPLDTAGILREGEDCTVVSYGAMIYECLDAAEKAADLGIDCEVIDLRTIWPADYETVIKSVQKTGRLVVVHEAPKTCGIGGELVSLIIEKAFYHLEAPPIRVTGFDTPFPYSLESEYLPLSHRIVPAIQKTLQG